jgi:hypothetical protein
LTAFERLVGLMSRWWSVLIFIIFITLCIVYLDQPIAHYFHDLDDTNPSLSLMQWVTQLGLGGLYLGPLFVFAVFFRYVNRHKIWERRCWFLWLCVLLPSLVCIALKVMFGRARPELLFTEQLYGFYGFKTQVTYWSFPSGHTTTVMGFAFGLAALFSRYCYLFIVLGLAIVLSRVMLTFHYFSDVLVATYLALLEVGFLTWYFRRQTWLRF